ncbi:Pkinase-domain-containing protein [Aureobasidium namibiae CBS 147.97]|uniref:non-specific serine/threonine protein kinase n=1 Tax=Aureobasidium namibiae CBS 147.97 TaxID=1043004 RepID=A0A074WPR3_9PEZI|nr:Pkinase-domain-containing protein [Aureobasidium namibiae CBS 147.97]KEQ71697.1 Pkinase-domain-containing protein [Aureobasidium namibiae CBS 147.97]
MNGDLSLSRSLGGLRIANPDSDDDDNDQQVPISNRTLPAQTQLHTPPPTTSTARSPNDVAASPSRQLHSAHSTPDDRPTISSQSSGSTITNLNHSRGLSQLSSIHQPDQDSHSQYAASFHSNAPSHSDYDAGSAPSLPSKLRPHVKHASSYRYRDDAPSQSGLARSASRAAAAAMAGHPPVRSVSRSYRGPDGQNVMPPRRSSQRITSGYGHGPAGSVYSVEGGPLPSSEEWKERGAAVATRQEVDQNGRPVSKIVKKGVNDFHFGRTLGEGSYSTVLAATDRQIHREYAVKVLDKRHIIKEKKVKYVNIEKDALNRLTEHPGIVRLYYTFQDERSLYFVLDLANGGELLGHLKKMGTFDEECTRFYGAQMLDSIAYMHSKGIIHRDLKPENVLLDEQMHTKITDFGTAKILDIRSAGGTGTDGPGSGDPMDGAEQERAVSFVGTAEYVSPELLTDKNACKASDLWAFGCILYQLLAGRPPFKASNEYQTFQKIVALDYRFPDNFPAVAKDLIERLLVLDPSKRLPIEHIKAHSFFEGIQWGKGLWKQKAPRLRSYVPGPSQSQPIRLNGGDHMSSAPAPTIPGIPTAPMSHATSPPTAPSGLQVPRPQLRAITELAPPSQLDIDWSPVLTRNNERIIKLGNLNVISSPAAHSPTSKGGEEASKKFSRFFGGATTKKRQRLVMITSSARVIIAAAGGDEKKAKLELNLLANGTTCKPVQDSKTGLTAFCINTRDKHFSFEDPRATTSDPEGSKYSTQEWLEAIDRAKDVAQSQAMANSYSGESQYGDLASTMSSPTSASGGDGGGEQQSIHSVRNTLRKDPGDNESVKSRKPRFSKRHSKSGLAAVF